MYFDGKVYISLKRKMHSTFMSTAMVRRLRIFPLAVHIKRDLSVKSQIDYTLFPTINETDLEEQQVKGSGPGGSKISTTSSCVNLKHIPTGIVVKCQETRFLEQNKKKARLILLTKLDNHLNGENSVEAQTKRLQARKRADINQRKEKIRQLKKTWKDRENIP